jgi:outer membrane protein assembly factor BamB/tetratricopeptide (TPR) repeat protein
MSSTHRAGLLIVGVALLAAVTFLQPSRGQPADNPAPPAPPTTTTSAKPDKPAADPDRGPGGEALILPTDRQVKRRLEAAGDYIKAESWSDAVRLLQLVLDAREDVFVPVRRPGKPAAQWVSARAEALRLFGTLPPQALEFYEVQYGGQAKARVEEGRTRNDPQLLDDVARRYTYTAAGVEAVSLLATYYLDRGRFELAAFYFNRLLERQPPDRLPPVTLFKATLAFRLNRDTAAAERTWEQLARRAGPAGIRLGTQLVRLEQLRGEIDRFQVRAGGDTSPVFRGNARRSGEAAAGGIPYLEPLWHTATASEPEARRRLAQALQVQAESQQAILPGACPILVGGKLVFRSYGGLRAVEPHTGKELWRADLPLSLDACLGDAHAKGIPTTHAGNAMAGKKVQVLSWLRDYAPTLPSGQLGLLVGGGVLGGLVPPGMAPGGAPPVDTRYAPPFLFENTTLGTLSSDARRVYAIDDLPVPPHPNRLQEPQPGAHLALGPFGTDPEAGDNIHHNCLLALDVETGKQLWERGGRGGKDELHDCYFLGAPLPVAGKLYVLVEKQGDIVLTCLDPGRGELVWSQPLAAVREKLLTDAGRRLQAVHLAYSDGVLVCPTNAGALLGVDILSRSLVWAYAYHDRPAPPGPDGAAPPPPPSISLETGPAWKASVPIIHDGKVIFTAGDDDAVHCLNLHDGSRLWRQARADSDLYVGAVCRDRVVVVGKSSCRALSLADGSKTVWTVPTGLPSGLGAASGDVYYLPLQGASLAGASGLYGPLAGASGLSGPLAGASGSGHGAVWAIDMVKGEVVASAEAEADGGPGNLLFHGGDLLAQSATTVAAYPQLRVKLAALEARLGKNSRDPVGLAERGELKLHQGDLQGAVADLHLALANDPPRDLRLRARDKLHDALTQLLQRDFAAGEKYLDEYRDLCRVPVPEGATPAERLQARAEEQRRQTNLVCQLARGKESQSGGRPDALRAYLDLYGRDTGGQLVTVLDDPAVRARLDVWVRGRVAALFARAAAGEARALREQVAREWQLVRSGDDVTGLERFATLFGDVVPEGREARFLLAERALEGRDRGRSLEAELALLRLRREADDPRLAARATEALARLMARKGLPEDALFYERALVRDYPGVEVRDGKTGADLLADLATDKRLLPYTQPAVRWTGGLIRADKVGAPSPTPSNGPQVLTFQFQGELTPSLENHVLVLDLTSSRLKLLDRATGAERWGETLTLDYLRSHLVQSGFVGGLVPCPVEGHLAVVNLGALVCGLDLLDRRVVWRRWLTDGPFLPDRMTVTPREGDGDIARGLQLVSVDRFGRGETHVLGRLGAAGAGCVTLQTPAGLVALDPVRGETLWARGDVPADADSFGDDRHVYLVERGGSSTRALRNSDGVAVADVPAFAELYPHKLQLLGRRLLLADDGDKVVLRLYDVPTGKDVWQQEGPKDALPLQFEDRYLAGVVQPDGKVEVVDLRTYKRVLQATVDPKHLERVKEAHLLQDGKRFYLAFRADPDPDPKKAKPPGDPFPCVSGMRAVPVNGQVYAFDRATGDLCWFNQVDNQSLLVEQFADLPIVLFAGGLTRQEAGQQVQSVSVQSIDKQTGKRLLTFTAPNVSTSFYALQVDARGKTIDLISPAFRVRHSEVAPAKK